MELSYAGDVEFGRDAALPSFDELHLRWFDRWLRGVDNGLDAEAPLRIFVMGGGSGRRSGAGRLVHGGRWRDEREWPLARTRFTDFYLHGDGSLGTEPPREEQLGHHLPLRPGPPRAVHRRQRLVAARRPAAARRASRTRATPAADERTVDIMRPGRLRPARGPGFHGCRPPYLPLGSRPDVLVFQTEPLREPTEVTGPIEVVLWVATSAVDTDFTAKLIDVYPPSPWYPLGYALNLTDSIARLRYRNGRERGELVTPGEPMQVTHHALPDEQPVHARPPHPARRLELELPALRRQPQHGRADRARAAPGRRRQHRVPRARAGVAGGAADHPDRGFEVRMEPQAYAT